MRKISPSGKESIHEVWAYGLANLNIHPEEITDEGLYKEGATKKILINAYERNIKARAVCIKHYGAKCQICDFDFEKFYGLLGQGYIHVHHLIRLADIKQEYELDPIRDLRPVCPNCHAMLHKQNPPLSIEDLKSIIKVEK